MAISRAEEGELAKGFVESDEGGLFRSGGGVSERLVRALRFGGELDPWVLGCGAERTWRALALDERAGNVAAISRAPYLNQLRERMAALCDEDPFLRQINEKNQNAPAQFAYVDLHAAVRTGCFRATRKRTPPSRRA